MRRDYRLHNNVAYLFFQLLVVLPVVHQLGQHAFETALVRARFVFVVGTLAPRILHKILVMLVYRIVRQMHIQIVNVAVIWLFIFFGRNAHEPIFEHKNSQRIHSIQQRVDSQIEFLVVNHVRIRNVSLRNYMFTRIYLDWISHKVNAPSLTLRLRLDDEGRIWVTQLYLLMIVLSTHQFTVLLKLTLEVVVFDWQNECLREKFEFVRKFFLHFCEPSGQLCFICDSCDARKLRDSLIRFQFGQSFCLNGIVNPANVKIGNGHLLRNRFVVVVMIGTCSVRNQLNVVLTNAEVQLFGHPFHDGVKSVTQIHYQLGQSSTPHYHLFAIRSYNTILFCCLFILIICQVRLICFLFLALHLLILLFVSLVVVICE